MEQKDWYSLKARKGYMRLYAEPCPSENGNLYFAGNLLLQKIAAPSVMMECVLEANFQQEGERAGLVVMGNPYSYIALVQTESGPAVQIFTGKNDKFAVVPELQASLPATRHKLWFRTIIDEREVCRYFYSLDGEEFLPLGDTYPVAKGTWIGAKYGIFCSSPNIVPSHGYADFDYVHISTDFSPAN